MTATYFPIFGTGGLWKVASGSGTINDPFVPAVNITGGLGAAQTPWAQAINGAGFSLSNADIRQYAGTGLTHGTSPVGTPLTMVAGTSVSIDTSAGTVEGKLPAPAQGMSVIVFDVANKWDANTFKLSPNGAENINGANASVICNRRGGLGGAICLDGSNWLTFGNLFATTITNKSSTYTFVLADAGQSFTNSGASNTLTIDSYANVPYAFGPDYAITLTNTNASTLTLAKTGAATINGANANRTITAASTGIYQTVSFWSTAADTWILAGNYT